MTRRRRSQTRRRRCVLGDASRNAAAFARHRNDCVGAAAGDVDGERWRIWRDNGGDEYDGDGDSDSDAVVASIVIDDARCDECSVDVGAVQLRVAVCARDDDDNDDDKLDDDDR